MNNIQYLKKYSTIILSGISRIFSWSIFKYFEPRKCFWDSVKDDTEAAFLVQQNVTLPI